MKKIITALLLCTQLLFAGTAFAETAGVIVTVDGELLDAPIAPRVVNGRIMLPMRAVYETLGAQVTWKDADKIIFATKANKFITMKIGVPKVVVQTTDSSENAVIELDCEPFIDSGYTLIPVRAAAEALDARVDWSEDTRVANIVTK